MNLQIETLKQQLATFIGESNLPVGIIVYILKDLYLEIEDLYQQQLKIEQNQLNQQNISADNTEPIQGFVLENNENE